ncbi:MAG: helicase-related protein [Thermoplasmata archaeon]
MKEKLKNGMVISGPYWPEPVVVKSVRERGESIEIIGMQQYSGHHVDVILTKEQIERLKYISEEGKFKNPAWKVFLAMETIRYRYASLYDPLLALNVSKVDPLPHQIEAVYGYILKMPRIRFLIADDPGAGKTIMAGLIIKELKLRGLAKRIMIVCPGHLKDQWMRELKEHFDENFQVVDRHTFENVYNLNPWESHNQIITSMDFAKRDEILPALKAVHFDLIIVDEAHKMSAYRYGEKLEMSERYKLGKVLSQITTHLVFLTATPHKGDPENFRLFLDLLEPGFFATEKLIEQSLEDRDNPLFIRRMKEDLKDINGRPLFLPRYVRTVEINLGRESPEEKELYNALSRYVETQYNLALKKDKKRNVAFALVILQRRFASSTYALLKSLERRKHRLEELLANPTRIEEEIREEDIEDVEDMTEEERWKNEETWEVLSASETREELKEEIDTLQSLIERCEKIISEEKEIKLIKLKESLNELREKVQEKENRKIIIFTESRDTLEYLVEKLKSWEYAVNFIHGGMKLRDRVDAEVVFKNETEVLVATEAAGEGINLQFCNLMINYDIPWNPTRLEQRMGRIHRYGQKREVFVHNLVASDTREGSILHKLLMKLEEMRKALGGDKVFDVIGEIIDSKKFAQAMIDAAVNARPPEEIWSEIGPNLEFDEKTRKTIFDCLGESLATRFIDHTAIKRVFQKAKEQRLIPEYTETFFIKAFERAGGRIKRINEHCYTIEEIPGEIRKICENLVNSKNYTQIVRRYPCVTFDKDAMTAYPNCEFLSFGHTLFDGVLEWVEKNFRNCLNSGAIFYDPDGILDGYILFYEGEIKDGTGSTVGKRIFSVYLDDAGYEIVHPSILWDLEEENEPADSEEVDLEQLLERGQNIAERELKTYLEEMEKERVRQCNIKEKYGVASLKDLIERLVGDILSLEKRSEEGEDVDLALKMKQERRKEYIRSLEELKNLIEREKSLTMCGLQPLGVIRVKPLGKKEQGMKRDIEIERIGMKEAMEFEKNAGRIPEDVSAQNLGYDIRSTDASGNVRYIEVKARVDYGDVALTRNEWFKAKRFGSDYYLYVVYNAGTKPELYILQDPARNLRPVELVSVVRYVIHPDEIIKKGG